MDRKEQQSKKMKLVEEENLKLFSRIVNVSSFYLKDGLFR